MFSTFGIKVTTPVFIGGFKYDKKEKAKFQIYNFISGEAKLAIYMTRRDTLPIGTACELVSLWSQNVRQNQAGILLLQGHNSCGPVKRTYVKMKS